MALKNTESQYGSVAKFFHWTIALLIITMLFVGFFMDCIPKDTSLRGFTYNAHKVTGIIILALVCCRFIWMLVNRKPALPGKPNMFEKIAEHTVHWCFYMCMFAMPISGWVMATAAGYLPNIFGLKLAAPFVEKSKYVADLASEAHEVIAWVIIVLLVLHIGAALVHHFIKKDNVLNRMRPCGKN